MASRALLAFVFLTAFSTFPRFAFTMRIAQVKMHDPNDPAGADTGLLDNQYVLAVPNFDPDTNSPPSKPTYPACPQSVRDTCDQNVRSGRLISTGIPAGACYDPGRPHYALCKGYAFLDGTCPSNLRTKCRFPDVQKPPRTGGYVVPLVCEHKALFLDIDDHYKDYQDPADRKWLCFKVTCDSTAGVQAQILPSCQSTYPRFVRIPAPTYVRSNGELYVPQRNGVWRDFDCIHYPHPPSHAYNYCKKENRGSDWDCKYMGGDIEITKGDDCDPKHVTGSWWPIPEAWALSKSSLQEIEWMDASILVSGAGNAEVNGIYHPSQYTSLWWQDGNESKYHLHHGYGTQARGSWEIAEKSYVYQAVYRKDSSGTGYEGPLDDSYGSWQAVSHPDCPDCAEGSPPLPTLSIYKDACANKVHETLYYRHDPNISLIPYYQDCFRKPCQNLRKPFRSHQYFADMAWRSRATMDELDAFECDMKEFSSYKCPWYKKDRFMDQVGYLQEEALKVLDLVDNLPDPDDMVSHGKEQTNCSDAKVQAMQDSCEATYDALSQLTPEQHFDVLQGKDSPLEQCRIYLNSTTDFYCESYSGKRTTKQWLKKSWNDKFGKKCYHKACSYSEETGYVCPWTTGYDGGTKEDCATAIRESYSKIKALCGQYQKYCSIAAECAADNMPYLGDGAYWLKDNQWMTERAHQVDAHLVGSANASTSVKPGSGPGFAAGNVYTPGIDQQTLKDSWDAVNAEHQASLGGIGVDNQLRDLLDDIDRELEKLNR